MIIFFNKTSGDIVGTIEGRIHSEAQLGMWIGDKSKTTRIIVNWKPVKYFDKDGFEVPEWALNENGDTLLYTADFEPDSPQKDIFMELDTNPSKIYDYKVDPKTKELVKK